MTAEFKGSAPISSSVSHSISGGTSSLGSFSSEHSISSFSSRSLASFNNPTLSRGPAVAVMDRPSHTITPHNAPDVSRILPGTKPFEASKPLFNDVSLGKKEGKKALSFPSLYEAPKLTTKNATPLPRNVNPTLRELLSMPAIYQAPPDTKPAVPEAIKSKVQQIEAKPNVTSIEKIGQIKNLWQSPKPETKPLEFSKRQISMPEIQKELKKEMPPEAALQQKELVMNVPLAKKTQELLVKSGIQEHKAQKMVADALQIKLEKHMQLNKSVSPEKLTKVQIKPAQQIKLEQLQKISTQTKKDKKIREIAPKKFLFIKDDEAAHARELFIQRAILKTLETNKKNSDKNNIISGKEIVAQLPGQILKIKSAVLKGNSKILNYLISRRDRSWDETKKELKHLRVNTYEEAQKQSAEIMSRLRPVDIADEDTQKELVTHPEVRLVLDEPPVNTQTILQAVQKITQ